MWNSTCFLEQDALSRMKDEPPMMPSSASDQTQTFTSRVDAPVYGGTFRTEEGGTLPFVLPGELVRVSVPELEVLEPSPERVAAGCVHFGQCGGCHYQQGQYRAQVGWKEDILSGLLATAGIKETPAIATRTAAEWGYRNRIRLRIEPEGSGFRAGYSRPESNQFLPIVMCPIAAPLLWRAAEALLQAGREDVQTARWLASAAEVELFCTGDESKLQAMFFLRDAEPARTSADGFARLCERLRERVPELAGAGAELHPELNRRVRRGWAGAAWGAAGLHYACGGRAYWVSRGAFFQVNRFLVETLLELVCAQAGGGLAWDLYAGVGLFSRALAERCGRVIAVESGEVASRDLAAAARGGKGQPGFTAVRAPVLEFLEAQATQRERPELVVLDPPRAGLGVEGAAALARVGAKRIVYVSCDPVTLARDLAVLTRAAYGIESVEMVDLFPQTFHLETVVFLIRR